MPAVKNKIVEFNQFMNSDKMSYIIDADNEFLNKKIDGRTNNPENSSCGYPISTTWSFDYMENKHTKHTKNTIDFEKKKMLT